MQWEDTLRSALTCPPCAPNIIILPNRRNTSLLITLSVDNPRYVDAAFRLIAVFDAVLERGLVGVSVGEIVTVAVDGAFDDVGCTARGGVGAVVIGGTFGRGAGRGVGIRSLGALTCVRVVGDGSCDGDG